METTTFETQDLFEIMGRGVVITGILRSGTLCPGMTATINGHPTEVKEIEIFRKTLPVIRSTDPEAKAVGVLLTNVTKADIETSLKTGPFVTFAPTPQSEINVRKQPVVTARSSSDSQLKVFIVLAGLALLGYLLLQMFR